MYITINDIKGEKRIDLSYSIHSDKEIGVIRMLKEYCHAAHSQTQNKGFLSYENQHPIII